MPPRSWRTFTSNVRLCFLLAIAALSSCKMKNKDQIRFWISDAPFSADPLDYDAFIHHITFSSVYAGLVTNYRAGQYTGMIAEKWEVSPDQKEWTFYLRTGLRFENGDPITAEDVSRSWLRMAKILSDRGSKSGLFEKLSGYPSLKTSGDIPGIKPEKDRLTLHFSEPMPQLLDLLSFGLYSIVHKSCYDETSGKWKDPHKTIASGPYSVSSWTNEEFSVKLRTDFPRQLLHPRPLEIVNFVWNPDLRKSAEIISGNSKEPLSSCGYSYHGEAESRIAYIRCQSWTHPASPLHDKEERKRLRGAFYSSLQKLGFNPTLSFFPLAISGVNEFQHPHTTPSSISGNRIRPLSFKSFSAEITPLSELADKALRSAASASGYSPERKDTPKKIVGQEFAPDLPSYHNDLVGIVTGILLDSPDSDIRFMFRSKEGIRLPDPSGRADKLLGMPTIEVQKVNEVIWDDAIIWPVSHLSVGLWAGKEIDFSLINTIVPPTAIHLIGWE